MAKTKKDEVVADIESLSNIELLEIIEDRQKCGSCTECKAYKKYNVEDEGVRFESYNCNTIGASAFRILKARLSVEDEPQETEESSTEPSTEEPSNMLPYKITTDYMKKHGYKRCYMCGSDLYRKEDEE